MTSQPGTSVRFQCPACAGQIKIPSRQAGQTCRCPKCNAEIVAPEVADGARQDSAWDDDDFFGDSLPAPAQAPAPVPKPPIETPPPKPSTASARTVSPPPAPAPTSPASPVASPSGPPLPAASPADPKAAVGETFEIECDLCGALLRARRAHIGQTLPCPTCHSKVKVADPTAAGGPAAAAASPVSSAPPPPTGKPLKPKAPPPSPDEEFGVECRLCHSLVYVRRSQIGSKVKCHDCHTDVLVTEPKRRPTAAHQVQTDDDGGDFQLSDPVDSPSAAYLSTKDLAATVHSANAATPAPGAAPTPRSSPPQTPPRTSGPGWAASQSGVVHDQAHGYLKKAREEIESKEQEADPPPAKPFVSGMISFLFDWEAAIRWAFLVLFGYAVISVMSIVLSEEVHPLFRLVMIVVMTPIALIYLDCAAVCFLAIVQDTSSGFHKIRNWPGMNFLDWMFDGLYIINCLWVSSLVGVLAGVLVGCLSHYVALLLGMVSMGLLFPILFMSVLEQGSPLGMASPKVWQSLKTQRQLWLSFYARSLGLVVIAAAAMAVSLVGWFIVQMISVAIVVTLSLVYFRLLGRLAWCLDEDHESGPSE